MSLSATFAEEMIAKYGRDMTFRQLGTTADDPLLPGNGPDPTDVASFTAKAVAVDPVSQKELGRRTEKTSGVSRKTQTLFVYTTEDLEDFDEVLDGGAVWQIQTVRCLQPGDTVYLYQLEIFR